MDIQALADESYVCLTTFKRSGEAVATPVWVVADPEGEGLLVMTRADSGKVKRLRHDPRVTLQACGRFGLVHEGSPVLAGRARVGAFDDSFKRAFKAAYGVEARLRLGVRRGERVALHIS
jgi:PPOX class probable F420-dependent enzyme